MTALKESVPSPEKTQPHVESTQRRGPTRSETRRTRPAIAPRPNTVLRTAGAVLSLLAVLLLGFIVYVFALSGVQEQRAQSNLFGDFRSELAQAVAPTTATVRGAPIALLDVPAIGLHHVVVVEGTSAGNLTHGPGHLVSTPLPGQAGVSTLFGRRATFGAPFGRLYRLRPGDEITVTTGNGVAHYRVNAFGDSTHAIADTAANRLVLITTDSPYLPRHTITVSARLEGNAVPAAALAITPGTEQQALRNDPGVVLPLMMWSAALVLLALAGTYAVHVWSRWPAYLVIAPVLLAVLWNVYENAAQLLPNLY